MLRPRENVSELSCHGHTHRILKPCPEIQTVAAATAGKPELDMDCLQNDQPHQTCLDVTEDLCMKWPGPKRTHITSFCPPLPLFPHPHYPVKQHFATGTATKVASVGCRCRSHAASRISSHAAMLRNKDDKGRTILWQSAEKLALTAL